MKQQLFEQKFSAEWQRFAQLLQALENQSETDAKQYARDYRRLCYQLALARSRNYSPQLQERLNELVLRGHHVFYQRRENWLAQMLRFVVAGFPQLVRAEWRVCLIAALLLYLPALIFTGLVLLSPDLVYSLMDSEQVKEFEQMYNPQRDFARGADTDMAMFGHYIQNNIGIGFRTFAGGIIFGLGSIFFLLFNGALFGGLAGHVINLGYQTPFFSFVVTHGAFELTAIVLSGGAGLKLGYALIAPGRYSRADALKRAAKPAIQIMYGVVLLLLIAAFVEAFWSSSHVVKPWGKYLVGGLSWGFVTLYFLRMGRL